MISKIFHVDGKIFANFKNVLTFENVHEFKNGKRKGKKNEQKIEKGKNRKKKKARRKTF